MSTKSRHSNLLKDALRGQTPNDEPSELWSPLPDQGWRPCGECTRSSGKPEKSSGYLQIFLDGGLNQQRMGICDAVAVAKILNATLVIPLLEVNLVWQDSSSFEEIFDVDHFIDVLKDDISIVKELPYEFSWSTREFYASTIRETRVKTAPVHASDQWYTDNVLPILQRISTLEGTLHLCGLSLWKMQLKLSRVHSTLDSDEFREVENSEFEQKAFNESKQSRWKPPSLGTKQEWHERLRNIGKGRKGTEEVVKVESPKMSFPIYDENLYLYNEKISSESKGFETQSLSDGTDANKDIIPPSFVLKQLAIATESERNYKSVKDLLTSSASSSPVRERASLSISAVRSLVLRGKEEKVSSEFSDDKVWAFIQSILDAEGLTPSRKVGFLVENLPSTLTLARDIHGASPESLLVKVSEVIGSFKTLRKMAQFWFRFVAELRTLWLEEQYIPGVPLDELPDLNYCLLYQQLQLMNCCVSRKRRRAIATESLELLMTEADCDADGIPSSVEKITSGSFLYAKTVAGEVVLRLGASHEADNLTMLETGEPVFAPLTQEGPLLTEDLAREAEEFVLRTGSVGAGCSHLLSDMQAFKAANPGCILEDFVRWHSPPDWTEQESGNESDASSAAGDSTSSRGRLSSRMRKEGNLWRELWETAKPVPAVRQAPLFDEDLAVEGVLTELEEMSPSQLFGQLFRSLLGLGFVIAETKLSTDESILKLFYECKDFVVASYQGDAWIEKIDDLCQVYETVEAIFVRPEDVVKVMKQPEDANSDEPKHRFKKFTQIFNRKNRSRKSTPDEGSPDDTPTRQPFSNFFDSRSSLFSKRPPKPENPPSQATNPCGLDENDWTVV